MVTVNNKEQTMKKLIAVVLVALASSQALAWGDREQGIVTGIAATLLIQEMTRIQNTQVVVPQGQVQVHPGMVNPGYPQPYYGQPQYRGHRDHGHGYGCSRPTYDMYGRRTGCVH